MLTIGIDLGGTTFSAGAVDEQGAVSHAVEEETRQHDGPDILLPRLADAAKRVVKESSKQPTSPDETIGAIGIGVPGPVRHREGVCVFAPNLDGFDNLPVAAPLQKSIKLPVYVVNDANAAALGESRFGAGRGAESMLMVTLGTGIGSGIIIHGKLLIGASERGAEVGHMTIDINSNRGSAGNNGTLESMCGRDAIVWRAIRKLMTGRASSLQDLCKGDLTKMTPHCIATAANDGDAVAREVWEETAVLLAVGIVNVIVTTDIECVVIGGGVAQAGDVLFQPLRRAVAARTSQLLFDVNRIVPAELGQQAGIIGAAQWAREQLQ